MPAENTGGAESDQSNEASAIPERAHVLVINDEGDDAYAEGVARAVRNADRFVDQWDVRSQGSPQLADLSDYDVLVWNLGPEFTATISADEQTTLMTFLDNGGHLAVRSEALGGSKTFFAAFAFEGVSEDAPAPDNRTVLMRRLLDWLFLVEGVIFEDGFETGDTAAWN